VGNLSERAFRYAKFTYQVVKLSKKWVYAVNACLLNEAVESVTFRNPVQMLQTIRKYQEVQSKFLEWVDVIVPPKLPSFGPLGRAISEGFLEMGDASGLKDIIGRYGRLEKALRDENNRIHRSEAASSSHLLSTSPRPEEMRFIISDQPKKLSWRRIGRLAREVDGGS
jgi:hypothetical protein